MAEPEGDHDTSWVPKVDLEFRGGDEAYQFYNNYAKLVGFSVRKAWINRRTSGVIISRTYVCFKQGYQGNKKDEYEVKKPRKNERTGCLAHMIVKITDSGRYRVSEFHPMHNHDLIPPTNAHILKSHRAAKRPRIIVGNMALQKATIEYLVRQAGDYRQVDFVSVEDAAEQSWAPKVDMEFQSDDEAYQFYTEYGRKVGFVIRRAWVNRKPSGVVVSRTYVCYKEGFYGNKKDENQVEQHRPKSNERTGCLARMIIKLAINGKYRVSDFQPNHNHDLITARTAHLLKSHRAAAKSKTVGNMVGDARMAPKASPKRVGEHLRSIQCENHIPATQKCIDARKIGDVGAILQYMQERQADDKSFYYAIQFDGEDQVTNVFWADGKSMVDYYHFSDVICWDMTYRTSSYGRPFAPFYGVNHHKQIVFFGAALLYDESEESFKWLLTAFKEAMSGKQPTVILTDHDEAIVHATASVWQDTTCRTCVWHVYRNANKYLAQMFQGSPTFAYDFSSLVFDCEDEEEFISSWGKMLGQYDLNGNAWLNQLFVERKKWALPYRKDTFCADMRNIQRRESLNSMLKEYLDLKQDMLHFFKHYERMVDEHRQAEVHADFHATQSASLMVPSRMLRQAANAYTPAVLDMFRKEFEMSLDCMVYRCGEHGTMYEYKVTSEDDPTECSVKFDPLNGTVVVCSCKKFEFLGIQCRHVLKVLDILNFKELPARYLLMRWRKDAKVGSLRADPRFASDIDSNSSKAHRSSYLRCISSIIAARATHTVEGYTFIESQSDQLTEVYHVLQTRPPKELQLH